MQCSTKNCGPSGEVLHSFLGKVRTETVDHCSPCRGKLWEGCQLKTKTKLEAKTAVRTKTAGPSEAKTVGHHSEMSCSAVLRCSLGGPGRPARRDSKKPTRAVTRILTRWRHRGRRPEGSVGGTMEFARMENGFYEKLVQSAGMWAHVA